MPRSLRIEFPGARYHVMSRGNRGEYILKSREDKLQFLKTLEEACDRTGWMVHAYVLMDNHFHLLLETPEANLSEGMRWLQGTYGTRYNRRHGLTGHVWQGRFKSPVISDEGDRHFLAVSRYIHLNPARAGLLQGEGPALLKYSWSSFPFLCSTPPHRPHWLKAEPTLLASGLPGDDEVSRRKYLERLEYACQACIRGELSDEEEAEQKRLLRGWYIGEASFRDRLLGSVEHAMEGKQSDSFVGGAKKYYHEKSAEDLLTKACRHLGVQIQSLRARKQADWQKQMVAALLRKRSTASYRWIIDRLNMGSRSSVYNALKSVETQEDKKRKNQWELLLKLNN